jgi:hypothetical protein
VITRGETERGELEHRAHTEESLDQLTGEDRYTRYDRIEPHGTIAPGHDYPAIPMTETYLHLEPLTGAANQHEITPRLNDRLLPAGIALEAHERPHPAQLMPAHRITAPHPDLLRRYESILDPPTYLQ